MLKSYLALTVSLFLGLSYSLAQPLSAFAGLRDEFYVFDKLSTKKIDYLKPINFKVGGNAVAYIANDKSFKVYQNGNLIKVNDGFTTDYQVTGNYILMINNTSIYVFDRGKATFLARNPMDYVAADSIIGFSDPIARVYYIYTAGQIIPLTTDIITHPITVNAVGKNLIAYTTVNDSLKIYYHGKIYPQPKQSVSNVRAGQNIVAYRNNYDDDLSVFYKGKTSVLESFPVNNYFAGDDLLAYVTREREFMIFYAGKVHDIGNFTPRNLGVTDNIVTYVNELGYFCAFYKGEIYQLEKYLPAHYEVKQNSLFYVGDDGRINIFSFGKNDELPINNYVSIRLDYDVLQLELPLKQYKFYYNGNLY